MTRVPQPAAVLVALLIAATGCEERRSDSETLIIFAAASLSDVSQELAAAFQGSSPQSVTLNLASSGTLRRQIIEGAPADVFLSADLDELRRIRDHLIDPEPTTFALGALIAAVPKGASFVPTNIDALMDPRIERVAIGDPNHVPAGRYAREALTYAQEWEAIDERLVLTKDVRAAVTALAGGDVDAAIVYRSDLKSTDAVREAFAFDDSTYRPILYAASALRRTKHPARAKEFVLHLRSTEAREALERWGLEPVGRPVAARATRPKDMPAGGGGEQTLPQ